MREVNGEVWIDKATSRVVKMTATLYNVMIEGSRSNATLTLDLAAAGQAYNIKAPL